MGEEEDDFIRVRCAGFFGVEVVRGIPGIVGVRRGILVGFGFAGVAAEGLDLGLFCLDSVPEGFQAFFQEIVGFVQGTAGLSGTGVVEFAEEEGGFGEVKEGAGDVGWIDRLEEVGDGVLGHVGILGKRKGGLVQRRKDAKGKRRQDSEPQGTTRTFFTFA